MAKDSKYFPGLPEEVDALFYCTQVPGIVITKAPDRERIDLRKISVSKAEELVKAGKAPFLVAKKKAGKSSDTEGEK